MLHKARMLRMHSHCIVMNGLFMGVASATSASQISSIGLQMYIGDYI